jgi:hypothetical protein
MRKALSRRAVLAGVVAVTAAGGALAWRSLTDAQAAIRAMVMKHLRGAAVADGTVDAFVADFLGAHRVAPDGVAIGNLCDTLGIDGVVQACENNAVYLRRVEEQVIDLFVRSTDVFDPDRRRGAPIRYVALWDPYAATCRNPFADLS